MSEINGRVSGGISVISLYLCIDLCHSHLQTTTVTLSPSSCVSRIFKLTTCIFNEIVIANISLEL
jgi:hypothetical protein